MTTSLVIGSDEGVLEGAPDTRLLADPEDHELLEVRRRGQIRIAPLVEHACRRASGDSERQDQHGEGKSPTAHAIDIPRSSIPTEERDGHPDGSGCP